MQEEHHVALTDVVVAVLLVVVHICAARRLDQVLGNVEDAIRVLVGHVLAAREPCAQVGRELGLDSIRAHVVVVEEADRHRHHNTCQLNKSCSEHFLFFKFVFVFVFVRRFFGSIIDDGLFVRSRQNAKNIFLYM